LYVLVEDLFEKVAVEFLLERFTDIAKSLAPHVGDEILQGRVTPHSSRNILKFRFLRA